LNLRIFAALAALLLLPGWLGLFGNWCWVLELLSHFRWQYLFVAAAVAVWAAWRRRRAVLVLALVTLLLNAALIAQLAWQPQLRNARLAPDFQLRVLSVNVLGSNTDSQAVIKEVLASDADVAVFIEVNDRWLRDLQSLEARYPFQIAEPRSDNFGIALFSRLPLADEEVLNLGSGQRPSIAATMTRAGRRLRIIGTHPPPPMSRQMASYRNEQLDLLAEYVERSAVPVILVGDLNATPWSAGLRTLTAGALGFRGLDPPWRPTWRVRSPFAIPIDHAMCTAPLLITRRKVGAHVGSDHRPIVADFAWIE